MQKKYIVIVLLVIGIASYFFMQNNRQDELVEKPEEKPQATASESMAKTFTSSDKRLKLAYPSNWHIRASTPGTGSGQFGPFVDSWVITNFSQQRSDQGSSLANDVKVDFEIMRGGQNLSLESLVDCGMKTISCERVGIGNELFIKAASTLNTGMNIVQVATFYDSNVFRATAYIQTGEKQSDNIARVQEIFNSISFQNAPK